MKKIILLFAFLSACAPTTYITGTWKNPKSDGRDYRNIFIATLTGNTVARSTTENDMEKALQKYGVNTTKSLSEFPPSFAADSIPREDLMKKVKARSADAILTISLLKKSTESRYVRGGYDYMPMARFGYYGTFWGYYNYWHPYAYSPGYYSDEDVYYLETNLYDVATEALLWSAQSKTYTYSGLSSVSKEFATRIAEKMKSDGILK